MTATEEALLQAQNAAIALTHQDTQRRAEYEDLKRTMHNMTRNHALQLEAARMAGVHSVQEQTAVIVRAALELLESIEGETPFTAEAARAFKRVFGA
jgi:hypothetical protein